MSMRASEGASIKLQQQRAIPGPVGAFRGVPHQRQVSQISNVRPSKKRRSTEVSGSRFAVNLDDHIVEMAQQSFKKPTILQKMYRTPSEVASNIVNSVTFECLSAFLIVASGTFVGIETDYLAKHNGQTLQTHVYVHMLLNSVFLLEFGLRILAEGCSYFTTSKEVRWNWSEAILAGSSAIDLFLAIP